jgi:hypothetical protein
MLTINSNTPWGEAQDVEKIAEGIESVMTAGHGGFKLSTERHAMVRQKFPDFHTFAGGSWYEEDCDVAVVVVTFPECFKPETVEQAKKMVANDTEYFGRVA